MMRGNGVAAARLVGFVCVVLALVLRVTSAHAEVLTSTSPAFTMKLPDGFQARPDKNTKNQIFTYHREGISRMRLGTVIGVDRLQGTIGRERMKPAELAVLAEKGLTAERGKWKTFDIDVIRGTQTISDYPVVVLLAQVPLSPEAIQVKVLIDADDEAEGRALLTELLNGLDGKSNWMTQGERLESIGTGLGQLSVFVAIIVVIVGAIIRAVRRGPAPVQVAPTGYQPPAGLAPMAPMPTASTAPSSQGGSVKCAGCGLIGFGGTTCRRCGSPI